MVFPQPLKEADKAGVNLKDIGAVGPVLFLKLKGGLFIGSGKNPTGMVAPLSSVVVQYHNGPVRRDQGLVGLEYGIGASGTFCLVRSAGEIKYRHGLLSF